MLTLLLAVAPSAVLQSFETPFGAERRTPLVEVVDAARPAVVCIEAISRSLVGWNFGRPVHKRRTTTGSGVVVYEDGYIVTNYHVVARAELGIRVTFDPEIDETVYDAQLVSAVPEEDLALLKIERAAPSSIVRIGTSSDLMLGERVVAIGNSYGKGLTVSAGIISGLHRDLDAPENSFKGLIQTDAAINPGNSGGPLLNIRGELVGISTLVKVGAENMGYAIPVDTIVQVLQDQLLGDSAARAWLGFEVGPGEGRPEISAIVAGGPAHLAGMRVGDFITHVDGKPLASPEEFNRSRMPLVPNQLVSLSAMRGEEPIKFQLRGLKKVDGILLERLGMTVERFAIGRASYVRVDRVSDRGAARELGLVSGDIIDAVRLAGTPQAWRLQRPADLAQLVSRVQPGTELALDILRDDNGDGYLQREELYKGTLRIQ